MNVMTYDHRALDTIYYKTNKHNNSIIQNK